MNLTFHPSRVRTREQIFAADRHRTVRDMAAQRESLFLAQDNLPALDYHDASGKVATSLTKESMRHSGYAERDGKLDIRTESKQVREHLQRSGDGSRLSLASTEQARTLKENFRYHEDGTISYSTSVPKSEAEPSKPVTYRLGAVSSPQQVEAHETYLDVQGRFQKLEELVDRHDGSPDFDFNESVGILATDGVPISPELILERPLSGFGPMTNDDYRASMSEVGSRYSRQKTSLAGYIAKNGEVSSTLNWELLSYDNQAVTGSYERSADVTSASIETKVKFQYEGFRERVEYQRSPTGDVTVTRTFEDISPETKS